MSREIIKFCGHYIDLDKIYRISDIQINKYLNKSYTSIFKVNFYDVVEPLVFSRELLHSVNVELQYPKERYDQFIKDYQLRLESYERNLSIDRMQTLRFDSSPSLPSKTYKVERYCYLGTEDIAIFEHETDYLKDPRYLKPLNELVDIHNRLLAKWNHNYTNSQIEIIDYKID